MPLLLPSTGSVISEFHSGVSLPSQARTQFGNLSRNSQKRIHPTYPFLNLVPSELINGFVGEVRELSSPAVPVVVHGADKAKVRCACACGCGVSQRTRTTGLTEKEQMRWPFLRCRILFDNRRVLCWHRAQHCERSTVTQFINLVTRDGRCLPVRLTPPFVSPPTNPETACAP